MKTVVRMWGHSLAVRIPRSFAREIGFAAGTPIDLLLKKGKLELKPLRKAKPSLMALLDRVSHKHLHRETATGRAVGREAW